MRRLLTVLAAAVLLASPANGREEVVRYFPSILYGQILVGPGASIYETTFRIVSRKRTGATVELYTDKGEPLAASFADVDGTVAVSDTRFRFMLTPDRAIRIKVQLLEAELTEDVAIRTGWATFRSTEDIEVHAIVRIISPEGKVLSRHVLSAQTTTPG